MEEIIKQLNYFKVIPVIAIDNVGAVLALGDSLIAGKLAIAEITFRTPAAVQAIRLLKSERPEILIGAGTILAADELTIAQDNGASFGVAPGFNPKIVEQALKIGFPFMPGIMTPSDIESALDFGLKVLKFFPAEPSGGVKMLRSIAAPYLHMGIKFIPTGGVTAQNFRSYLALDSVLAVGGTWIAKRDDIAKGKWKKIKQNCLQVTKIHPSGSSD
jgi:2-dehydro-3-deoxyphosphogluconate aldolase/(4S)-4-hydroxy-2-oxoglutarate aldolase